jgi:uncharacterized protein (TIGR03643 family)
MTLLELLGVRLEKHLSVFPEKIHRPDAPLYCGAFLYPKTSFVSYDHSKNKSWNWLQEKSGRYPILLLIVVSYEIISTILINMKKVLNEVDIEQIILMAWGDTITFETIEREYGLTANEVPKLMRKHQSAKTYKRWRERVTKRSGVSSKHEALSIKTSNRQKY